MVVGGRKLMTTPAILTMVPEECLRATPSGVKVGCWVAGGGRLRWGSISELVGLDVGIAMTRRFRVVEWRGK